MRAIGFAGIKLRLIAGAFLALALGACAAQKKAEPVTPAAEPQAPAEELIRDRLIVPGQRVGPVQVGMSLRKLIEAFGEPISSTPARMPAGRPALLYRYADPEASTEGTILVMVREHDQTVYSVQVEKTESFQTPEGVRFGASEARVRASFGKPQSVQSEAQQGTRTYCYLAGLAVRMDADGNVESITVFPGADLRKVCKAR